MSETVDFKLSKRLINQLNNLSYKDPEEENIMILLHINKLPVVIYYKNLYFFIYMSLINLKKLIEIS